MTSPPVGLSVLTIQAKAVEAKRPSAPTRRQHRRGPGRPKSQAVTDGLARHESHCPDTLKDAEAVLPTDVERDLARTLARALVQQFMADAAWQVDVDKEADT